MARRIRLTTGRPPVDAALATLRAELGVSLDFPERVLAEAAEAVRSPRRPTVDRTALPLLTIDPPGSLDLDQALHVERRPGRGYRVSYAIADVAAFVRPGSALDREAHARGQTLYAPDADARLHPPALSEGAASLLPGEERPALLWTMDLDAAGEGVAVDVRRALVRSRRKLDYAGAQRALDAGTAEEPLLLLREVGRLRRQREARLGGVELHVPEQEVEADGDGYRLAFRTTLPVEEWNAQISLLTGQAAAELMLAAGVGVLRTLPAVWQGAVDRLRRTARALGVEWPEGAAYADVLRTLDPARPAHAAVLAESTVLLRGSGYEAFDGEPPAQPGHAGVGAPYAHATAPLRRLVDRYVGEVCLAASAGAEVPGWARAALPGLPETMADSDGRAARYEAGIVSVVEAAVLAGSVGRVFEAVVVETDEDGDGGTIQLVAPAVRARCAGRLPLGSRIEARLVLADVAARSVRFELAGPG